MPVYEYKDAFLAKRRNRWVWHLWTADAYSVESGEWVRGTVQNRWVDGDTMYVTATFTNITVGESGKATIAAVRLNDTDGDVAFLKNCHIEIPDDEHILFRFAFPLKERCDYTKAQIDLVTDMWDTTAQARVYGTLSDDNELNSPWDNDRDAAYNGSGVVINTHLTRRGETVNMTLPVVGGEAKLRNSVLNTDFMWVYDSASGVLLDGGEEGDYTLEYNGDTLTITPTGTAPTAYNIFCETDYTVTAALEVENSTATYERKNLNVDTLKVYYNDEEITGYTPSYDGETLTISNLTPDTVVIECAVLPKVFDKITLTLPVDAEYHTASYRRAHLDTDTLEVWAEGAELVLDTDYTFTYNEYTLRIELTEAHAALTEIEIICEVIYG